MDILFWLVPPVVVTVLAMLWVSWVGRERGELDRDEAARRMATALEREPGSREVPPRRRERSTGVALRRTPSKTAPGEPSEPSKPEVRPERRAS